MAQGLEAVVTEIFVEIRGIDLAAILGGHVPLRPEERADRPVANVDRASATGSDCLVAEEAIEPAARPMGHPPPKSLGLVLREHDRPGVFGLHAGEELRRPAAGRNEFHQRRLVAHAHAADLFHHGRRAAGGQVRQMSRGPCRCPRPRSTNRGRRGSRPPGRRAPPRPVATGRPSRSSREKGLDHLAARAAN